MVARVLKRDLNCWTCGRERGLSQPRRSWGLHDIVHVPRPVSPASDLLCVASVYRNGGTSEETHLCDDCLRVGLRALYTQIGALLEVLDEGRDKDAQIVELTERLASLQYKYYNVCFDHNRMQDRLRVVLGKVSEDGHESEEVRHARWEVDRGKIGLDTL